MNDPYKITRYVFALALTFSVPAIASTDDVANASATSTGLIAHSKQHGMSKVLATVQTGRRSDYFDVEVRGNGNLEFYFLQWGTFLTLANEGGSYNQSHALNRVRQSGAFGPWPAGGRNPLALGTYYIFLPICGNKVSWDRRRFKQLNTAQDDLWLTISC